MIVGCSIVLVLDFCFSYFLGVTINRIKQIYIIKTNIKNMKNITIQFIFINSLYYVLESNNK